MKKILLGHLNSNGDCLFATVIARQIKEVDYPNCHLTWAVGSRSKQTVWLNPYVDQIWEIPLEKTMVSEAEWNAFVREAETKHQNGEFDHIFLTQITAENWMNYDGGIRSSTYNNYPHKITVPHNPIIRLSDEEVENVRRFADEHELAKYRRVVLVECGPDSFAVALDARAALEMARQTVAERADVAFVLSSNKKIETNHPAIIDGSRLSFRENAELTKHCDLLIGCASGITWLTTADWAKKLPMILVVNNNNPVLPAVVHDHKHLGLPTDHIIEIKSDEHSMKKVAAALNRFLDGDFASAKKSFGESIRLKNFAFLAAQLDAIAKERDSGKYLRHLAKIIRRNGWQTVFVSEFREIVWQSQTRFADKLLKVLKLKKTASIKQS